MNSEVKKSNEEDTVDIKNTNVESSETKTIEKQDLSNKSKFKNIFKKFRVPSTISIVLTFFFITIILTWIPHDSWYEYLYLYNEELQSLYNQGLLTFEDFQDYMPWYATIFGADGTWIIPENGTYGILNSIPLLIAGFFTALPIILYIVAIGGFLEILTQTKTLEAGISSLQNKFNGKEIILVPVLFILFSLGGTTFGMQGETVALIPLIIPFFIFAGFDAMVGLLVIIIGTTTGIAASVVNPFSVGVMADGLSSSNFEVTVATGIVVRIILWVVLTAIGVTFVTWYAARVKKNPKKSFIAEDKEKNEQWANDVFGNSYDANAKMTKKQMWAIILFIFAFLFMIFALLPWTTWFSLGEGWDTWSSWIYSGAAIGEWYFVQLFLWFFIMTFILGAIFKMSIAESCKAIGKATKAFTALIIVITISQAMSVVLVYSGFAFFLSETLFSGASNLTPTTFALLIFPIFLLLGFFIPSTSGLALATAPVLQPLLASVAVNDKDAAYQMAIAIMFVYPLAVGIINMFSPTTGIVIVQSEYSNVPYSKSFKVLGGYALMLILLSFILIPLLMLGVTNIAVYPY